MEQRDFFISYTKKDKAWAVWIADVLKRNGYSVYVQALDIRPGDDFLEKMEEFLENSRNFIAVWSKDYSKSRYCMNELRAAFHEWHDGRINCLLPVRVNNHPMKALYAALVHVELSDMGAASEATLADAVRRAVPRSKAATDTETNTPEPEEDAETLYQRGEDYYYGRNGVNRDYDKAREYYEQAANRGHAGALRDLGYLYVAGRGVPKDYDKARRYYEQAAAKGDKYALYNLGLFYEYGRGVEISYFKALSYYEAAAAAGYKDAPAKIEEMRTKLFS